MEETNNRAPRPEEGDVLDDSYFIENRRRALAKAEADERTPEARQNKRTRLILSRSRDR